MSGSHVWAAVIGAIVASFFFVVVPLLADLRPFGDPDSRWSRRWRKQLAALKRIRDRGTP